MPPLDGALAQDRNRINDVAGYAAVWESVGGEMKALIHIGLPKCGSGTLQSWRRLNRDALETVRVRASGASLPELILASIHVAVHELGVDEETAWRGIAPRMRSMKGRTREIYETLSGIFQEMTADPGVFLYCHEYLFMRDEIQIISLDRYLSKFFEELTYVVYIRDTIDLFTSLYSQILRGKKTMEFQKWLVKCIYDPRQRRVENYFDRLLVWDRVVGERLNVRLLESDWLTNGDLIEDFSSLVGVGSLDKPPIANASFAAEYIEYIRFLNLDIAHFLPLEVRKRVLKFLTFASSGKPRLSVSDDHAESIRGLFREKEEKIRKRFFPNRPFLFRQKFRGEGLMPAPLSNRRKAEIETEIRKQLTRKEWESYSLALRKISP